MIENLVLNRFPDDGGKAFLTNVPNSSIEQFFLPLSAFDYSREAKNGCNLEKEFIVYFSPSLSQQLPDQHSLQGVLGAWIFQRIRIDPDKVSEWRRVEVLGAL